LAPVETAEVSEPRFAEVWWQTAHWQTETSIETSWRAKALKNKAWGKAVNYIGGY
jgi:hypothetical protein